MSSEYVPAGLRRRLRDISDRRCSYCRSSETLMGIPREIEHIIPRAKDGKTTLSNRCFACHRCNQFKSNHTEALDDVTGKIVPLFNPRVQIWHYHFKWSQDGIEIIGNTPCGRATVAALKLNNENIVVTRRIWIAMDLHPPID
jgi:HNH endonuclease